MATQNGVRWVVCPRCQDIHAPTHPCTCTPPLGFQDEPAPLCIPAVVIWRWVLICMWCGILIGLAVIFGG